MQKRKTPNCSIWSNFWGWRIDIDMERKTILGFMLLLVLIFASGKILYSLTCFVFFEWRNVKWMNHVMKQTWLWREQKPHYVRCQARPSSIYVSATHSVTVYVKPKVLIAASVKVFFIDACVPKIVEIYSLFYE